MLAEFILICINLGDNIWLLTASLASWLDAVAMYLNVCVPSQSTNNICYLGGNVRAIYEITINSLWPCDAIQRVQYWSIFVYVMICCLFSAKPSSKPMLISCQVDHWEQIAVKFQLRYQHFPSAKRFENVVCGTVAIWCSPQCVKSW